MTLLRKQHLLYNALCAALEAVDIARAPHLYAHLNLGAGTGTGDDLGYSVSGETCILTLTGQCAETSEHIVVQSYIRPTGETDSLVIINGATYSVQHPRVSILI